MSAKHSVSVAVVVVNEEGKILVIQRRDTGDWQIPGGVLELGETIQDGLRREVREETGLDVEPVRLTGVYQNMQRDVIALVFLAIRSAAPRPRPRSRSRSPGGAVTESNSSWSKPSLCGSSTRSNRPVGQCPFGSTTGCACCGIDCRCQVPESTTPGRSGAETDPSVSLRFVVTLFGRFR